jgi:transketolase
MDLIKTGHDIYVLTADLGYNLLDPLLEMYPKRFLNVGVSEANMIGIASGMAMRGKRVYCYSIAPFSIFRPLDQIRADLCAPNLPVTILSAGGGVCYGMEGMTHNAIEDLAIVRALPNMTVMVPADPVEADMLVRATVGLEGPCYLRLAAKNEPVIYPDSVRPEFGRLTCLKEDGEVAIIANGIMVGQALTAASHLQKNGINCRVYSLHTVKPLDLESVRLIASQCRCIVSVEEHSVINGCGTAIAEILLEQKYGGIFLKLAFPDKYDNVFGSASWLRARCGLDASGIVLSVQKALLSS